MFRFLSRVVVASVFALSLNITLAPAAHATPNESGRVDSGTSRSWVDAAVDWLNQFLGRQVQDSAQSSKKVIAFDSSSTTDGGSCIDPWGNPRPCP